MKQLDVFEPPMCCSTGICGQNVDSNLVQFAADIEWLKGRGVVVRRFSLSQDPQAFMNEPGVLKAVSFEGTHCLPLLVRDGKILSHGTYPTRDQLAVLTGLARTDPLTVVDDASATASCCTPSQGAKAGCCSR